MAFRLVFSAEGENHRALLAEGESLRVGSAADSDVRLREPTVSRRHARFRCEGETLWVEDLGSRNGTVLGSERIQGSCVLAPGDTVRLGDVSVGIERVDDAEASLAVRLDGPCAESVAVQQTRGGGRSERFALGHLASLLVLARQGASRLVLADAVANAALDCFELSGMEVSEQDGEQGEVLLLRHGLCDGEAAFESEHMGLRARFWTAPQAAFTFPQLARALLELVALAGEPKRRSDARIDPPESIPDTLVDPVMRDLYARARRVARSELNVLIRGESGTGKEVLARWIRDNAGGGSRPFVAINCAALPQDLVDAELFGVERGVATGVDARAGLFEQADGGIVFLDEIGDMSPATQARILRVLQEREVTRIGGARARAARVRILAATNQDLEARVADGRFRLDLFHRIADWQVVLPPLRERPRDVLPLALRFLDAACAARGIRLRGISRAAAEALTAHDWPGNVRELEREMARAAVFLGDGDVLGATDLRAEVQASGRTCKGNLRDQLEAAERRILQLALDRAAGSVAQAAQELGLARSTLYRRLGALGLAVGGIDQGD